MTNASNLSDNQNLPDFTLEIDALNERAWKLESIDPQEGIRLSKEAFKLSNSGKYRINVYKKGIADSLFNQAHFNLDCGDFQLALSQSLESLSIYTDLKDSIRQTQALCNLGAIYLSLNEYNKSMSTLLKALEIARHLEDGIPLGEILMTIGMVYLFTGDSLQAILEFKRSLQIFSTGNQSKLLAYVYCNLAAAYKSEGEFDIFKQYLDRCEKLANQLGSDLLKIDILRQKGQYELQMGNLNAAHDYFQSSLKLAEIHGYQADEVASSLWMSDVYFQWGKLQESSDLLMTALNKSKKYRFNQGSLNAHHKLAQIFEQQNDYQKAYEHLKAYLDLDLKINAEKNELKYKSLETVYRTQSLQTEARIIQNKNDQLEKEITERRWAEEALRQSDDKYRRLANLDPLTGLNNRRYFYTLAQNEFKRIKRYFHPLTIMMIDIDHFKNINDQFGHLAGDQVLKMVARQLETFLREVDILGRFGGEEFVVLMPETTLEQSIPVANRLLRLFTDARFEVHEEIVQITVSIGIAAFEEGIPIDRLVDRADKALQSAKKGGRNRISVWDETKTDH
jgi:diguanylate cyclase (GGDEF)-like protein